MEKSLLHYIWKNTWRQQFWILLVVAVSMVPYFLSFDLPKRIINGPIQGAGFENPGVLQKFLSISYDIPFLGTVVFFEGFELDRAQILTALSLVFLSMVVVNGLFKLYINTYKGRLGERMLRRIRFELVDRVLRFPPKHFKRVKSAELATMIKDEVESFGGFTGDAFVQPALLGGQAMTTLIFIFVQNVWLGMTTVGIVLIQIGIIPRMRRKLLELGRSRQLQTRELSGRVSEIVDGIETIHSNDTSNLERADIAWRLGRIFSIRYDLYQWKFLVKFINNFLAQVTPFLFYAIGGYFVLQGKLDIGQLVAVIAAYKDLPGPLKDLIDWDQARQDVQVKYAAMYEYFGVEPLLANSIQAIPAEPVSALKSPIVVSNLQLSDDSGAKLLDGVSVTIEPNETVAIVGPPGSGAESFAEALARATWPDAGQITIDGQDLLTLPEAITGRRMSYASAETFFLQGTLWDNLLYGLKHAPQTGYPGQNTSEFQRYAAEARKSGNPEFDLHSNWIDYEAAGITRPQDISMALCLALDTVQMSKDIFELALRSMVEPSVQPVLVEQIVRLRPDLRKQLIHDDLAEMVIPFDFDLYNDQATVEENLFFGKSSRLDMTDRAWTTDPNFQQILRDIGLDDELYKVGFEIAENIIELFRGLPPHHPYFQQLTFMTAAELPFFSSIVQKFKGMSADVVPQKDRMSVASLSFAYIEPRHRFGIMTADLREKIVIARQRLHASRPDEIARVVERFDPNRFMGSASLLDNALFGRIAHQMADASDRIRAIVEQLLRKCDIYDDALSVGLKFDVGAGGRRLTIEQRQKLNLARILLKRSDYLILNKPLSALDQRIQDQIVSDIMRDRARQQRNCSIVWVLSNPRSAKLFDRILVFHRGALVGVGNYDELSRTNAIFRNLIS